MSHLFHFCILDKVFIYWKDQISKRLVFYKLQCCSHLKVVVNNFLTEYNSRYSYCKSKKNNSFQVFAKQMQYYHFNMKVDTLDSFLLEHMLGTAKCALIFTHTHTCNEYVLIVCKTLLLKEVIKDVSFNMSLCLFVF